jgi:PAS domain S-box-containing protein
MGDIELILKLFEQDFKALETFIDILPHGVYLTLASGEVLLVNNYIINAFEYPSKDEYLKLNLNTEGSEINQQTRKLFLATLNKYGKVEDFTFEYETYNGKKFYAKENATLITNPKDGKQFIVGSFEDITEEIELQEEQIKTSNLISSVNEALFYLIEEPNSLNSIETAFNIIGKTLILSNISVYFIQDSDKLGRKAISWSNDEKNEKFDAINLPLTDEGFEKCLPEIYSFLEKANNFVGIYSEITPKQREIFDLLKIKSVLICPIIFESKFIGYVVFIDNVDEHNWTEIEVKLLSLFANSIGNNYYNNLRIQEIINLKLQMETIINASNVGIWDWDLLKGKVQINSIFAKHIGIDESIDEISPDFLIDNFDAEEKEQLSQSLKDVCCGNVSYFTFDFQWKIGDKIKWLNHSGKVTKWCEDGSPAQISGVLLDITDRKNYEERISEQNEKLDLIINTAELMFCEIDKEGNFVFIRGKLLEDYNFTADLLNHNISDIPDVLSNVRDFIESSLAGSTISQSIPIGNNIIDFKSHLIYDENGQINHLFVIALNQTIENKYRLEIERTNQQLYAILEAFPGPVSIINENLEVIDCNTFLNSDFQFQHFERIDELENFVILPKEKTFFDKKGVLEVFKTHKPVIRYTNEKEDEIIGKAFLIHSEPVFDDQDQIWAVAQIAFDITDLKKAQNQLKETVYTKDKFFDIIAHDLKNPIYSVASSLDDLIQNYSMLSIDDLYDINLQIQKSVSILSQLLNNLLEWSRTQTGRINFNPDYIDVSYLANNVQELYYEVARQKGIVLINEINQGTYVWGDSNMLFTVLRNLVSNAIKYTESGGNVEMHAINTIDKVIFSVKDNGIGMSQDKLSKLFKVEFVQSTPGTNQEKGTGLGLILCKEFIERNGGSLWVESEFGKGTTFNFSLNKNYIER